MAPPGGIYTGRRGLGRADALQILTSDPGMQDEETSGDVGISACLRPAVLTARTQGGECAAGRPGRCM